MTPFPAHTLVRVTSRKLSLSGTTERSWLGRVVHSWDDGAGLVYTVAPDDPARLPCEVRHENMREVK